MNRKTTLQITKLNNGNKQIKVKPKIIKCCYRKYAFFLMEWSTQDNNTSLQHKQ